MIAAFLLALREGLEAALIVAVIATALRRSKNTRLLRYVWTGLGSAVLASLAVGGGLVAAGLSFEGRGEEIFEGAVMLLAAGVLTWALFWMQRYSKAHSHKLKGEAEALSLAGVGWGIFGLVFIAVFREGIETALFLIAASFSSSAAGVLGGGLLGIATAVMVGWLLYTGGLRLRVRVFFRAMSVVLILVAAGLFAHGIHELQEAAVIPVIIEHVWDVNAILNEKSVFGQLLNTLFGYNGNPSLIEVIGFFGYLIGVTFAVVRQMGKPKRARQGAAG